MSFISNLISFLNKTQLCEKHNIFYFSSNIFLMIRVPSELPAGYRGTIGMSYTGYYPKEKRQS